MPITWIDGFEEYSSGNNMINAAYTNTNVVQYGDAGRFSGSSLAFSNSDGRIRKSIPQTNELSCGMAVKYGSTANTTSGNLIVDFRSAAGAVVAYVGITNDGAVVVGRGEFITSNQLVVSDGGVFSFGQWNYLEVEFVRHASSGSANVYINGALVASVSGVNTGVAAIGIVAFRNISNTRGNLDDIYITDEATKLGECRVDTLVPSADTAQKDFAASSGSDNYAMVDELPVDGDTTYVSADAQTDADLYEIDGLSDSPATIYAVQVRAFARKTDTGLRTLRTKLVSDSTTANGVANALSESYQPVISTYELDPDTEAPWTPEGVNASLIGMEIVT